MKVQELTDALKAADFKQEPLDSGCNYTKETGHISLICYIEPNMVAEFISIYHWNNNDVKGTYNITIKDLDRSNDSVEVFFRKTKNTMPQYIGESADTHEQLEKAIEKVFR
ncbi:hypothetical protein [Bacteroides sp. 51]|uniref:hypothetical protein n=1 Tax=Bacteroides sp. 51 TaxID=2302938 RepID=UPI0013CFA736|nr:hypothetical protein [Bacteroides sp. 51]NDV83544.1 hypothetical protein [Bacteroides sp. 51]